MKNILMTILVSFALAGSALAVCSDADRKALEAFDRAWTAAIEKGDRAALTNILADEFTGMPAMLNKTQNIEGVMQAFERNKANPQSSDRSSSDNFMISCTPASATITHRNVAIEMNETSGREETVYSRSVHFLEKRSGKWQVVSTANHGLDDYGVLMYMEHDWNNSYMKRDASWFDRNFASDYSGVSSGTGRAYNKAAELAELKNEKGVTESAELSDLQIRVDRNMAIATGVNHVKGRDDKNQPFDYRVRFTDTFIKRDGRWQVWASQGTRIP
jgi:ketosteroid isomerase-like protein